MNRAHGRWWLAALLLPFIVALASAASSGLSISAASVKMLVGDTASLQIYNAYGSVSVSTSNSNVAVASISDGKLKITAKKAGSATLSVRDRRSRVSVAVTVTTPPKDSSSSESGDHESTPAPTPSPVLTVTPQSVTLAPRQSATVVVTNASGRLSVSVSNTSVVSATLSGSSVKITASRIGTASVTVKDSKGSVKVSVTVQTGTTPTPSLTVTPQSVTLAPQQVATVNVANAQGILSATVSNTSVASATISGSSVKITAKQVGTASVTVKDSKTSVVVSVTVQSGTTPTPTASGYTLLAWNDLGMHCMDGDFSVFSILPPYNNLHAQLVDQTNNGVVTQGVTLTYESMADPDGSINTISSTKTNFWQYVDDFFGASPAPDVGLTGNKAPSTTPQPLTLVAASKQFTAEGVPITPIDDAGHTNAYPMVKVVARNSAGTQLAQARVVLPVSTEMSCTNCHSPNTNAAARPSAGWITDANSKEVEWKKNILALHDDKQLGSQQYQDALAAKGYQSTGLLATATGGKAILCAACHASNALAGTGVAGIKPLTEALHGNHAMVKDPTTGVVLDSITNRSSCYQCHPGSSTKCLRGAMGKAVDANGNATMDCQSCHGTMSNVGRTGRVGWLEQPNCQACHHDSLRDTKAVSSTGILKQWTDTRFATNANAPAAGFSLYRFSAGHGGLQCEACHGATHAVYPSSHRNDNILAQDVQGHEGTINECTACHKTVPNTATGGPHGMHTTGSAWVSSHKSYGESNRAACAYCHGADYRGSPLSAIKTAKTLNGKSFAAGHQMNCYDCHNGPGGG
ncbi:MAG: hypothetical protein PHR30_13105 [Gallionellaceae bacterium]|nr:hypothetical protein [Gallionellaceae bacterium]